jgi:hypothetical protein
MVRRADGGKMNRIEDKMCAEYIRWRNLNMKRWPCLELLHHIPNEGKRKPWVAKRMGILAGLPDYHMPVAASDFGTCDYTGFWLEMKAPKKKPTKTQLITIDKLITADNYVNWTDNLQQAIDWTAEYCRWVHGGGQ